MRFTVPVPMMPAGHLLPLAKAAEQAGYDAIAMSDSVFYPAEVSGPYPYTKTGERFWAPDAPFVDPLVGIPAMAAVTSRLRFLTNVLKTPLRNPLLLAKQVSSIAALSEGRLILGVGLSWMPEEFAWCGTDMHTRGERTDEAIAIIRAVCAGGGPQWVEHHGKHYDFDRLMISPAPDLPVPIVVGGHSDPALRRAARTGDGWVSVNITAAELAVTIDRLAAFRAEAGRGDHDFSIHTACIDVFDADGFRRLQDMGVTDAQVLPWYYYGGDPNDLSVQVDALERFASSVIEPMKES